MENVKVEKLITDKQIEELIKYSNNDEALMLTTSDAKRFKDKTAFDLWLKKDRTIYIMTNSRCDLLGIIWFGKQTLPPNTNYAKSIEFINYGVTFAIRIYGNARGKGLARGFMKKTFKLYSKSDEFGKNSHNGIWLETNPDNNIAIKLYEQFGFKKFGDINENGRIIMLQF